MNPGKSYVQFECHYDQGDNRLGTGNNNDNDNDN